MALAETWVVCGTTFDDSEIEARIVALRRAEGHQSEAGCGKNIRADFAYRCVECGRWFHRECILAHFSSHGDHYANTVADLTRERDSLTVQLDSCQGALKETIAENSANYDRAEKAEKEREEAREEVERIATSAAELKTLVEHYRALPTPRCSRCGYQSGVFQNWHTLSGNAATEEKGGE